MDATDWVRWIDDDSGAPYWYSATLQQSVWTDPYAGQGGSGDDDSDGSDGSDADADADADADDSVPEWTRYVDDDSGHPYWHNSKTGESVWVDPTVPADVTVTTVPVAATARESTVAAAPSTSPSTTVSPPSADVTVVSPVAAAAPSLSPSAFAAGGALGGFPPSPLGASDGGTSPAAVTLKSPVRYFNCAVCSGGGDIQRSGSPLWLHIRAHYVGVGHIVSGSPLLPSRLTTQVLNASRDPIAFFHFHSHPHPPCPRTHTPVPPPPPMHALTRSLPRASPRHASTP